MLNGPRASTIRNILALGAKPSRLRVMIGKVGARYWDARGTLSRRENLRWLHNHATDWQSSIRDLEDDLVEESLEYARIIEGRGREICAELAVSVGGGGCAPLLRYLTRAIKPDVVVETGVAAVSSAAALLQALNVNNRGRLYSSDSPYFRLSRPEKHIEILVGSRSKNRWNLCPISDENSFPEILRNVRYIDIFYYDFESHFGVDELRCVSSVNWKKSHTSWSWTILETIHLSKIMYKISLRSIGKLSAAMRSMSAWLVTCCRCGKVRHICSENDTYLRSVIDQLLKIHALEYATEHQDQMRLCVAPSVLERGCV